MKELLKAYSIRAHEASRACDNYTSAAGFKMGHTDSYRHMRNNERDRFMQVMRFPENIGLVPVVIFSIGVTLRLWRSLICVSIVRAGGFVIGKVEDVQKK